MSYTLDGGETGFARLNTVLAAERGRWAPGAPATFDFLNSYEEHLFPDEPGMRQDAAGVVARQASGGMKLGQIGTLDDALISQLWTLSAADKVKLAVPGSRFANYRSLRLNQSKEALRAAVEAVVSPFERDVAQRIDGEFAVVRVDRMITKAGASDKSEAWHFDPTPLGFFKIFCYLNGPEAHDGGTELVDSEGSAKLLMANYHNVPVDARAREKEDLPVSGGSTLMQKHRGEAFLFNPALLCHRGHYPNHGTRHVFAVSILRSPKNWRETFDEIYSLTQMTGVPSYSTWPIWRH